MNLLFIWFLAYALPAGVAYTIIRVSLKGWTGDPMSRNILIVHLALIVSILTSQYFIYERGLTFPWNFGSAWMFFFFASVLLVFWMLGTLGLGYGLSAFIQQATMLSIAFLLLPTFSLYLVVLLIVPIYAVLHRLRVKYALPTMLLFFAWGTASILLFYLFHSIWLVAALHTLLGGVLIKRSVLYPDLKFTN